jgi:tetratricopeptide (TPR) repeat protein
MNLLHPTVVVDNEWNIYMVGLSVYSHCWESLADAYYGRGAYTASLKSYQRVLELDPNAVYPAFQVGTIKQVSKWTFITRQCVLWSMVHYAFSSEHWMGKIMSMIQPCFILKKSSLNYLWNVLWRLCTKYTQVNFIVVWCSSTAYTLHKALIELHKVS